MTFDDLPPNLRQRITANDVGCWLWQAGRDRDGYAMGYDRGYRGSIHWRTFTLAGGVRPDGYDLDHLCGVRHCVNPAHLEAVPHRINNVRGRSGLRKQGKTSRYLGVSRHTTGRWQAQVAVGKRRMHLGLFDDEESAAFAYDLHVGMLHRDVSATNIALGLLDGFDGIEVTSIGRLVVRPKGVTDPGKWWVIDEAEVVA